MLAADFYGPQRTALYEKGLEEAQVVFHKRAAASRSLRQQLVSAFLPEGFPHSVTPDYIGFQVWDSIQATCSYVRGILTSQAILTGVGVGQQAATPLSAVFQFFLRDFSGMLGGILFATLQGSQLDLYAKQWRLFADCLNNVGLLAELASPLFPSAFLFLACFGSIARSITGVAGGATRAALTLHFAVRRNAADISAKESSQETATTLLGMLLGMALVQTCSDAPAVVWLAFLALTVLHVYANVRALRALRLTTLNRSRADLLLQIYMRQGRVAAPEEVAAKEVLVPPPIVRAWKVATRQPRPVAVLLGCPLSSVVGLSTGRVMEICKSAAQQRYLVHLVESHKGGRRGAEGAVAVVLRVDADPADVLQAYVHAGCLAATAMQPPQEEPFEQLSEEWMRQHWPSLLPQLAAAGWSTDRTALGETPWRSVWGDAAQAQHQD